MQELLLDGRPLDLAPGTRLLPSFQVSDLLLPDKVQSDFNPELSLPGTARNHAALGHSARLDSAGNAPYQVLDTAALRADGADVLPRARLLLKGYEAGHYNVQLFAGNRRLVDALGDKTLQDLDLSRFNHAWSLDNVASRAVPGYWAAHGWGYEVYDRGRPFNAALLPYTELVASVGAELIWEQILLEAGFTAEPWDGPLLQRLRLPAAEPPQVPEAERTARRLRVGLGPDHEETGAPSQNREDVVRTIPFDDNFRLLGNVPPLTPALAGMYTPDAYSWTADRACYVSTRARAVLRLIYSEVRIGKAQARVELCVNGEPVVEGGWVGNTTKDSFTDNETEPFGVSAAAEKLALKAGDVLSVRLRLAGVGSGALGDKWGYRIFEDTDFRFNGQTIPGFKWEVTVLSDLPPGGTISLSGLLPPIKQLAFFKMICQLGGLSCRADSYEDHLLLWPSGRLTANAPRAHDWSGKRDQPPGPVGPPRAVAYRLPGAWAQRSYLRWLSDPLTPAEYGDGLLEIADASLPARADVVKLPFAATPDSAAYAGLLRLEAYQRKENEDPFALPEYSSVTPKPRLTLGIARAESPASGSYALTLTGGPDPGPPPQPQPAPYVTAAAAFAQRRTLLAAPPYFLDERPDAPSLDLNAYVLPVAWRGVQAMTRQARLLTERYRLSAADLADFLARPDYPVWDEGLGGYFAVRRISEFDPGRPTEVELARLHPELLSPPAPAQLVGREFFGLEFYTPNEFY